MQQDYIPLAEKRIGKYLIGDNSNLPKCFIEHFTFMWHSNPNKPIPFAHKQSSISFVISEKNFAPGHKYRVMLANKILELNYYIYKYSSAILKVFYDELNNLDKKIDAKKSSNIISRALNFNTNYGGKRNKNITRKRVMRKRLTRKRVTRKRK